MDAKLASELSARIKGDAGVIRELADKAEDVVWTRLKRYGVIVGLFITIIFALLAFIGFKTYGDLKASVLSQIQPTVAQIQGQANDIGKVVDDLKKTKIPAITTSLNQVQGEADAQKKRVEGADGQIAKSMEALKLAETKATADSDQFSSAVKLNQQQLDQIIQRSKDQVAQVTKAATQASVAQAYPSLGVEPQVVIAGGVVSSKDKKPGEKWISLVVSYSAVRENTYTNDQVEKVASSLTAAGFRVFIGVISITGRIAVGFERLGPNINALDSELFYYDKSKAQEAEEALQIASRIVNTLGPKPVLVEGSTEGAGFGAGIRYFEQHSGIDAQVFLSSEKAH